MDRLRQAVGLRRHDNEGRLDSGNLDAMPLNQSLLGVHNIDAEDGVEYEDTHYGEHTNPRVSPLRVVASGQSASEEALRKQLQNNEAFEDQQRREEEEIYAEIRARRIIEEEDRKLALRLQQELSGHSEAQRVQITVPHGVFGGQFVAVQIPGKAGVERVQVPPGLEPGMTFTYVSSGVNGSQPQGSSASVPNVIRVTVPEGAMPGGTFPVVLPNGARVSVMVPTGCQPGDLLDIPVEPSQTRANSRRMHQQPQLSEAELKEREEFLAALPEDIRNEILAQEPAPQEPNAEFSSNAHDMQHNVVQQQQQQQPPPPPPSLPKPMSEAERKEREEFLAALPEDIREEVLAAEAMSSQQQPQHPGSRASPPPTSSVAPDNNRHAHHDVVLEDQNDFLLSGDYAMQNSYDEQDQEHDLLGTGNLPGAKGTSQMDDNLLDFPCEGQEQHNQQHSVATSLGTQDVQASQASNNLSHENQDLLISSISLNNASSSQHEEQSLPANPGSSFGFLSQPSQEQERALSDLPDISSIPAPQPPVPSATSTKPPLQRLKEAREQLDKGEITQAEFDAIKKEVIAAI